MLIIGELLNSTRSTVKRAIEEKNAVYLQGLAKKQVEAGAGWIDVNAGAFASNEVEILRWMIEAVRNVTDAPLSIDSPRAEAIEAGLSAAGAIPFLNSISAEKNRYRALIPLVKKYSCRVVALSIDDSGMTDDMSAVCGVADGLIKRLQDDGVPADHIFCDPLVRPVSISSSYAIGALSVIEKIRADHPGVHTICGLSNVSYGLPKRKLINQTFVAMAIARGMDAAIVDPLDRRLMAVIYAAEALAGVDSFCMNYITAEREGKLEGQG
jgi:cobalamin-dependent methionine synthase I